MSSPRPVISPRKKSRTTLSSNLISGAPPPHHQLSNHDQNVGRSSSSPPPPKKRRIQHDSDLDSLMRLYKMARETMHYCEGRLRSIKRLRCDDDYDDEVDDSLLIDASFDEKQDRFNSNKFDNVNNNILDQETIGGIPRRFLDLSQIHSRRFPKKKFPEESAHVIVDNEAAVGVGAVNVDQCCGVIDSFSDEVVGCVRGGGEQQRKHASIRITITNAPLPHVNGTYIQEGTYNRRPLFVRVGPPRKFMGKFDCCVVLRCETGDDNEGVNRVDGSTDLNDKEARKKSWKIGLVPSHTITHPRLIGYYQAEEMNAQEPPVEGWKVEGSRKKVGGLKILYDE